MENNNEFTTVEVAFTFKNGVEKSIVMDIADYRNLTINVKNGFAVYANNIEYSFGINLNEVLCFDIVALW